MKVMNHCARPAVLLAVLTLTMSCSTWQDTRIPGLANESVRLTEMDEVPPLSSIQEEIRLQYAKALNEIPDIKADLVNFPNARALTPQTGMATFSGRTQLVQTDSGNFLAVFPFTGKSTLTPNFGVSSRATGVQDSVLNFSISPIVPSRSSRFSKIGEGDYLAKMISAMFKEHAALQQGPPGAPKITNREITVSTTFTVVQTFDGGLGVRFLPSGSDADSVAGSPAFGAQRQQTGRYKLDLKIPLVVPEVGDTRRIYESRLAPNGAWITIERPYSRESLDQLGGMERDQELENAPSGTGAPGPAAGTRRVPMFIEKEYEQ